MAEKEKDEEVKVLPTFLPLETHHLEILLQSVCELFGSLDVTDEDVEFLYGDVREIVLTLSEAAKTASDGGKRSSVFIVIATPGESKGGSGGEEDDTG